jgi:hypothetical protein
MDSVLLYSDGSKMENGTVGAGAVIIPTADTEIANRDHHYPKDNVGIGPYAEVFDAEIRAIALGIDLITHPPTLLDICSDNHAALSTIAEGNPYNSQHAVTA